MVLHLAVSEVVDAASNVHLVGDFNQSIVKPNEERLRLEHRAWFVEIRHGQGAVFVVGAVFVA
mgnify:CR=1 FL=1